MGIEAMTRTDCPERAPGYEQAGERHDQLHHGDGDDGGWRPHRRLNPSLRTVTDLYTLNVLRTRFTRPNIPRNDPTTKILKIDGSPILVCLFNARDAPHGE